MVKQYGRKLPDRKAGPYIVKNLHPDTEFRKSRAFYVARQCKEGERATFLGIWSRSQATFAETLITARALFYAERKHLAAQAGWDVYDTNLHEDIPCASVPEQLGLRSICGYQASKEFNKMIERALREMKGEG